MSAFHAQILASDTLFFDGDCEFMVVPCTDGAMGILSHHSNMIAAVVPGELRFQPERPEDIDVNRARRAEDAAKEALLQKKSMQEHRNAEAQLARAISRLRTKEHWNSRR